jgi:activator of 2-hydroxyglutaryl-CoA dehydratase
MPRRSVLSASERESLMALPETTDELIRHSMFNEADLSFINSMCTVFAESEATSFMALG